MVSSKSPLRWLAATFAIATLIALGFTAQTATAAITSCSGTGGTFAGGAGTTANPYLVSNQAQLERIRTSTYRTCAFRQTTDIALTGAWTPIGGEDPPEFTGEYDGGGKLISGINIPSGSAYVGLFGYTLAATLKNIRLAGSVNAPGAVYVGALVGLADRPTTIINVHSSVDVSGQDTVGGLVGFLAESTISRSSSSGSVTSTNSYAGGLVGLARSGYGNLSSGVSNSYATGAITSPSSSVGVGGLIGVADVGVAPYELVVANSYATGLVTGGTGGSGTSGGLIGPQSGGTPYLNLTVDNSFWDTQTTGKSTTADNKGTGKTTAQMKSFATFSGATWDITNGWSTSTIWGICDGSTYPFLTTQYTETPCVSPTPTPDPTPTPTPDPTPTKEPRLRVSMGGAGQVQAGRAFKLGIRLRNAGTGPAKAVDTCLELPRALFLVSAKRAKVSGRSICWTRSSLGAGRTVAYKATVRASSSKSGSLGVRATVRATNASGGSVSAGGEEEVRVVQPEPEPRPQPPTG